jgi:hypothetical protein
MQLDKDEIRDYEQRVFLDRDKNTNELNPLNIFFAVLAAILVSWLLRSIYIEYQIRQVANAFKQELEIIEKQSQIEMQKMHIRSELIRDEANRKAALNEDRILQQKFLVRQLELDKEAEKTAILDEKTKKNEAWNVYYKPSKGCQSGSENIDLLTCGNEHAKARKNFEAAWAKRPNL